MHDEDHSADAKASALNGVIVHDGVRETTGPWADIWKGLRPSHIWARHPGWKRLQPRCWKQFFWRWMLMISVLQQRPNFFELRVVICLAFVIQTRNKQRLWSEGPLNPSGPWVCAQKAHSVIHPWILLCLIANRHSLWSRGTLPVTGLLAESVQKASFSPVLILHCFDQFCRIFRKLHRRTAAWGSCCSQQSADSCCTSGSPTDRMAVGRSPDMPRLVPNCSSISFSIKTFSA